MRRPTGIPVTERSNPLPDFMTTAPPDISDLRIDRDQPRTPSGGRGKLWFAGILVLALAGVAIGMLRAPRVIEVRRDHERAKKLRQQDLISTADLENAQTKVDVLAASLQSAIAQRRLAEANVENTLVRAPFDGTVLRKDAEVGEIVAPSSAGGGLTRTAIVTMADLTTLEVEVDVNEAYIARIRGAQPARIVLDAYPDTSFSGRVR